MLHIWVNELIPIQGIDENRLKLQGKKRKRKTAHSKLVNKTQVKEKT